VTTTALIISAGVGVIVGATSIGSGSILAPLLIAAGFEPLAAVGGALVGGASMKIVSAAALLALRRAWTAIRPASAGRPNP